NIMRKFTYMLIVAILFVGLQACGSDSSTGREGSNEPPTIPDVMAKPQPDLSLFENNKPAGLVEPAAHSMLAQANVSNYNMARMQALRGALFSSFSTIYASLFPTSTQGAKFKNGMWVWSYGYSAQGVSWSMKFTSEDAGSSIKWAMYQSYDDGQGNSIQNYQVIVGTTAKD